MMYKLILTHTHKTKGAFEGAEGELNLLNIRGPNDVNTEIYLI